MVNVFHMNYVQTDSCERDWHISDAIRYQITTYSHHEKVKVEKVELGLRVGWRRLVP